MIFRTSCISLTLNLFNRLLVSIGLGLPISIYLWQRGDTGKPSTKAPPEPRTEPRGATKEYSQRSEGVQDVAGSSGYDVVRVSSCLVIITSFAFYYLASDEKAYLTC
jgi:hypothetical protein